jgi:hypothetical protein
MQDVYGVLKDVLTAIAKAASTKRLCTSKLDLNVRKKLSKGYIWGTICTVLKLGHFGM